MSLWAGEVLLNGAATSVLFHAVCGQSAVLDCYFPAWKHFISFMHYLNDFLS